MSIITTSSLPAAVQQSFNYKLLSTPTPPMIHSIAAMRKNMPRNGGLFIRFRRYNPLNSALVPLGSSGITPPSGNLTAIDIDAKINWYGSFLQINEQVTLTNNDPVLNAAAERLGVQLRQTEDQLISSMLASTASFINCTGGVNGDNPTEITRSDIDEVTKGLKNNNAETILDNIEGKDKFGTAPIRNAYFAMCSTNLIGNLDNVAGFVQVNQYPSPMQALESEWGAVGSVRFLVSSIGSVTPNVSGLGADVYNIFITGMEAYCCVDQDGASAAFLYRPPVYNDPLFQNCTIGWKMAQAQRLLNDLWLFNLRCTVV